MQLYEMFPPSKQRKETNRWREGTRGGTKSSRYRVSEDVTGTPTFHEVSDPYLYDSDGEVAGRGYSDEDPLLQPVSPSTNRQRGDEYDTDGENGSSAKQSVAHANIASAGTVRTFFNITKCFLGAASFELPWALKEAGLVGGIVGLLMLALLSTYTLRILVTCGHLHPSNEHPTYPDIGRAACGKFGVFIAWFGVVAMTVGVCGSYLVFIGESMSALLLPHSDVFQPIWCTLMVVPVVILLSWLRTYKWMAPISVAGVVALLFAIVVTLVDGALHHPIQPIQHYYPLFHLDTYPLFLGNAAFVYLIHSVVLPVEQSLVNKDMYRPTLSVSVAVVTAVNLLFSVLAYLFYGADTQGNVIANLTPGVITILVRIFLSLDLLFTAALFLFPVSEALERELLPTAKFGTCRVELARNLIRTLLVGAVTGIALAVPYFSILTGLSGGFGNNLLGFILPPILYLRLRSKQGYFDVLPCCGGRAGWGKSALFRLGEILLSALILCIGLAMMYLSTYACIQQLIALHR